MKKMAVLGAILLLWLVAMPAVYTQSAESPAQKALGPEDMEKLQKDLAGLAKVLGLEVTKGKEEAKKAAPEKTIADVLDKALDISTVYVASVAQTLQKVAPELWRIMIRQQYANAISYLVVPWGLVLLGMVLYYLVGKIISEGNADFNNMNPQAWRVVGRTGLFVASGIVSIVAVFQSVNAVKILINPEYYAIKDLLAVLLGRGGL